MGPTLKTLVLTDALKYRIAIVRQAEQLVWTENGYCDRDVVWTKAELADELFAEIERQTQARADRLARLPARTLGPVVDVRLTPKRRKRA